MKCPHCSKVMEKKKDTIKEDGISFEAYYCKECGEELMTMSQLKALAKQYRKLRTSKEVTFAQWGNSLAVRIPHEIADEYHLSPGSHGILTKDKDGIKIIPA